MFRKPKNNRQFLARIFCPLMLIWSGSLLAHDPIFSIGPPVFVQKFAFALKAGIQIPLASDLNGSQDESDYRFKTSFE